MVRKQNQYGGMNMFHGATLQHGRGLQRFQRGYGIGGLFKGLFRTVSPMLKKGLLYAGKHALEAGARALDDVRENDTTITEALKTQARAIPRNIINRSGVKRKADNSKPTSKRKSTLKRKPQAKKKKTQHIPDNLFQ